MEKTIKVDIEVWEELMIEKIKRKKRNIGELIKELIKEANESKRNKRDVQSGKD